MISETTRVGDLVVRAYAWPVFDIGVIIDVTPHCEKELEERGIDEYVIKWSTGGITNELDCELENIEEVYEDLKAVYGL